LELYLNVPQVGEAFSYLIAVMEILLLQDGTPEIFAITHTLLGKYKSQVILIQ
jgi:hypothetical protein